MPQSRADLERQLQAARARRDAVAARLQQQGIAAADLRKQPAWRNAHAAYRQLTRRLRAVAAKEQLVAQKAARAAEGE